MMWHLDWDFSMPAKLFIRWIMTALLLLCRAWFIRHLALMMLHDNIQQIISRPNFNEACVSDRYSYSQPNWQSTCFDGRYRIKSIYPHVCEWKLLFEVLNHGMRAKGKHYSISPFFLNNIIKLKSLESWYSLRSNCIVRKKRFPIV